MPRILLDFEPELPDAPDFRSDTSELVYFLSWAYSQRYGANHEMSQAALILKTDHKIDLAPLLTFADRNVEEPSDEEALERAWQDAAPLAEACDQVVEALRGDNIRLHELLEEYPNLADNIAELGWIASWAAGHGARIRVTYDMEDE